MPHVPRMLPADRFFARINEFECQCPDCGRLLLTKRKRPRPEQLPIYNRHTQQLRCPTCQTCYIVGLIAFPVGRKSGKRLVDAPVDARPTRSDRLELARLSGGWVTGTRYQPGETSVNYAIDSPCSCPARTSDPACPVHGTPATPGS